MRSQEAFRNPVRCEKQEAKKLEYTREQQEAIRTFQSDYEAGIRKTYLVYGITGSGKTEVYMEMIHKVVQAGKQAIVLIPEIALTYQTVLRFYQRFGDRVSILNSRLSAGERSDQMERVKRGEVDVMMGPGSALFTPFSNLGLIVIDEEHERTYKSEQVPRYHARETAEERARMEGPVWCWVQPPRPWRLSTDANRGNTSCCGFPAGRQGRVFPGCMWRI